MVAPPEHGGRVAEGAHHEDAGPLLGVGSLGKIGTDPVEAAALKERLDRSYTNRRSVSTVGRGPECPARRGQNWQAMAGSVASTRFSEILQLVDSLSSSSSTTRGARLDRAEEDVAEPRLLPVVAIRSVAKIVERGPGKARGARLLAPVARSQNARLVGAKEQTEEDRAA